MGPIAASAAVDAPRAALFDLITDLSVRPAFTDHFLRDFHVERLPPRGVGAGGRFRLTRGGTWFETAIEEAEPPHMIVERGRGGRLDRIKTSTVWEIVEGPGAVNTLTVTYWTEPPTIIDHLREFRRTARWYRHQWEVALRRLRDLAESGGDPPQRVEVAGRRREPTGVP
jgi:hypothetical protein